jgi:hypothetical protein
VVCSLLAVYCHQRISNSECIGTRDNFFTASWRDNPQVQGLESPVTCEHGMEVSLGGLKSLRENAVLYHDFSRAEKCLKYAGLLAAEERPSRNLELPSGLFSSYVHRQASMGFGVCMRTWLCIGARRCFQRTSFVYKTTVRSCIEIAFRS